MPRLKNFLVCFRSCWNTMGSSPPPCPEAEARHLPTCAARACGRVQREHASNAEIAYTEATEKATELAQPLTELISPSKPKSKDDELDAAAALIQGAVAPPS